MQNIRFQTNQKHLFELLEGIDRESDIRLNADESKRFWSNIWEKDTKHNGNAKWLRDVKRKFRDTEKQLIRCYHQPERTSRDK